MTPDLSVLAERNVKDVVPDSIRPVTEGVWFAMREDRTIPAHNFDIRNGVWWTHSGSHIVSLATGTSLHSWGDVDWETYVFKPDVDIDVCCHTTLEAAEACALTFIRSGHWCTRESGAS